jgi:hypothetical protein
MFPRKHNDHVSFSLEGSSSIFVPDQVVPMQFAQLFLAYFRLPKFPHLQLFDVPHLIVIKKKKST